MLGIKHLFNRNLVNKLVIGYLKQDYLKLIVMLEAQLHFHQKNEIKITEITLGEVTKIIYSSQQ